jgi:SAM-dependent methyltransferase
MKGRLEEHLEQAFGSAEPEHFAWQTECPYVADRERELVRRAFTPLGDRVLDIGCGEGATLLHLGAPPGAVGVDLFGDKIAFARDAVPGCEFVQASAAELPFEDGRFDHVLVRDVIHHLDDPATLTREADRVLSSGGRLDVLEPCRYNPLIAMHALVTPAERGELRSTVPFLTELLARRFDVVTVTRLVPMPIHRIVFHPNFGAPALAQSAPVRGLVATLERWCEHLLPHRVWSYIHIRCVSRK